MWDRAIINFKHLVYYLFVLYVWVLLLACMSTYHLCVCCSPRPEEDIRFLEWELETFVNWTQAFWKSSQFLTTDLPLQQIISFWIKFLWTKQLTAVLLKHSLLCSSAIRYRMKHSLLQVYSLHVHVITQPYNCNPYKVKPTEKDLCLSVEGLLIFSFSESYWCIHACIEC